jgi:pimeloyl-ACP methyl ester carboxylesterase
MTCLLKTAGKTRAVVAGALLCALTVSAARGADGEAEHTDVRNLSVTTGDGWRIALTYHKSQAGRESPIVVLLHMKGGNRLVWNNGFAEQLWDAGYAVIAVDLRGHGESKPAAAALSASGRRQGNTDLKAADYRNMVTQDLEAVKQFIFGEHEEQALNMRKMAIVAPEMSAPIALNFAMLDWLKRPHDDALTPEAQTPRGQDVRALVLISPEESLSGMNSNDAIALLREPARGVAFYIGYGTKDKKDEGQAQKIYKKLTQIHGNEDRMYLIEYPIKLRGTDLFGQPAQKLEANILTFLDAHLKQLTDPWRDRKSRLGEPEQR